MILRSKGKKRALGGDLLTQDEVRGQQGIRGGEIRGPNPIVDVYK